MKKTARSNPGSFGVLFWIAVIMLLIILFIANKSDIDRILTETRFFEILRPVKTEEMVVTFANPETGVETVAEDTAIAEDIAIEDTSTVENTLNPEDVLPAAPPITMDKSNISSEDVSIETIEDVSIETIISDAIEIKGRDLLDKIQENIIQDTAAEDPVQSRAARLYYAHLSANGNIQMIAVERTVNYRNNPMTETINALLHGPTSKEQDTGLLNLIPQGTKLLSAWIRDGIAYLNFNENFMFNSAGSEGTLAQLQQIIYSTTEFSTVNKVQILIDGKKKDYLSQEGIFIGEPLGRNG